MKADVIVSQYSTIIGVCGDNVEDIKNIVMNQLGLSEYGKSQLKVVNIRDDYD